MNTAETFIVFLLFVIAWLLFQIVKQLSYLTGVKIKLPFVSRQLTIHKQMYKKEKHEKKSYSEPDKEKKLPN